MKNGEASPQQAKHQTPLRWVKSWLLRISSVRRHLSELYDKFSLFSSTKTKSQASFIDMNTSHVSVTYIYNDQCALPAGLRKDRHCCPALCPWHYAVDKELRSLYR